MKRRAFIAGLAGAAAFPFAVRAQQAMPVVGYVGARSLAPDVHLVAAFRQGLAETGHVDGQNVTIEYRWAEGQPDRAAEFAADLVRRRVSVVFVGGRRCRSESGAERGGTYQSSLPSAATR